LPICAPAQAAITASTAPRRAVRYLMSKALGLPPYTMGVPGLASWLITTPLRFSALDSTSVPAMVTGLVAPICGAGIISPGMPYSAQSRRFWQVTSLHIKGDDGQQSKMARGLFLSSSGPPIVFSSRFFI